MLTNIRYVLMTALRDRIFIAMLAGLLAAAMLASFLGETAFLEEREMKVVYAAGTMRVIVMLGIIVFACFHLRHAFDTKEIDVLLSHPVSRTSLVLSYWVGFCLVGWMLAMPAVAVILLLQAPSLSGFFAWSLSLGMEVMFVTAVAIFTGFMLSSATTAVMTTIGFYVLARIMVFFVMTAHSPQFDEQDYSVFRDMMGLISIAFPRLDLFAKTEWLIYGLRSTQECVLYVMQTLIYVPLLLVMSVIDFKRKEF